jgi:cholesterol transport system auxiliary component
MIPAARGIASVVRPIAIGACALALSGCVTLLPKSKPAQLYRFDPPAAAAKTPSPPVAETIGVYRANGTFQGAAAGDRILTVSGGEAAFLAGSRWVAPATVLFNEAISAAFDANPGRVRLISRGERAKRDYSLRLDVRNFEARYDSGVGNPPTVVVRVRATMTSTDLSKTSQRMFEATAEASDNRVGAIVAAYGEAVGQALDDLVAWTDANAAG